MENHSETGKPVFFISMAAALAIGGGICGLCIFNGEISTLLFGLCCVASCMPIAIWHGCGRKRKLCVRRRRPWNPSGKKARNWPTISGFS